MPKPSDFFIGVTQLFAVLIPGALITGLGISWALQDGDRDIADSATGLGASSAVRWIGFVVAAYVLGHVLSAIGGLVLDPVYDFVYRDWWIKRHDKKKAGRYELMAESSKRLAHKEWSEAFGRSMSESERQYFNTYAWAQARVMATGQAGAAEIERTQADSKFFRSFVLVLLAGLMYVGVVGSLLFSDHRALEAGAMLVLLLIAAWRYFALRMAAVVFAYEHYLQLHVAESGNLPFGRDGAQLVDYQAKVVAGPALQPDTASPVEMTFEMPNPRAETTTVTAAFSGGHLLHLAVAACVANDVFREAQALAIPLDSVSVTAEGEFAGTPVVSTGIKYFVEISSVASDADIARLLRQVDDVAEIPATLRASTAVTRTKSG